MILLFLAQASSTGRFAAIKAALQGSKFQEAYQASDSLITKAGLLDADPLLFFLRGQAGQKLGKFEGSIKDLTRFLTSGKASAKRKSIAQSVRGWCYLRLGAFEDATADATSSADVTLQKTIKDAKLVLSAAETGERDSNFKVAFDQYQKLLRFTSASPEFMGRAARAALRMGNKTVFSDLSQRALILAPRNPDLLEMRGRFYLGNMDFVLAQKHLKLCMSVASNAGPCTAMLKGIATFQQNEKAAKDAIAKKQFPTAETHIKECEKVAQLSGDDESKLALAVKALTVKVLIAKNKKEQALDLLNSLVKNSPKNDEALIQRGEILMELGDYDGALADFREVQQRTGNNRRIENLIQKAAQLQEKENNIDYYTLLGVPKTASEKELKDAYRKAVIKWHPDRHREPLKKKEAEKKMKMINKAYDVLSDENKRRMYDMGQDPEMAGADMGGQPGGANFNTGGFGGFGGFGGGGQQFVFQTGPGGFGGFGGGFMDDIIKQMMGMGGNVKRTFTTRQTTRQQRPPTGNARQQQNQRNQRRGA